MNGPSHMDGCSEREQAAAYVLGALEHDEAKRYREHLEGCSICAADVASLQPIISLLSVAAPRVTAPRTLHDHVMSSVRSEAEVLRAAGPAADRPRPRRRARLPRLQLGRLQVAVASAAALGVGVLLGAVVINPGSKATTPLVTPAQLSSVPSTARAFLRQSGGHTELVVLGLPQPPSGKIYEIWLAPAGKEPLPTDALFGVTRRGGASVDVPGNLSGIHQVLVTAEPAGGSSHPTSTPIIAATLRS
jgi:anti-sigma-K factor RskA